MLYRFLVWISYFLLAIGATWPIAGRLGEAVPGSEGDVWVHLWTFRWVRDSLAAGNGFLFTDLIYAPEGVSLATHNFAWFHIALWIPLQAVTGEATAYSLIFIFGFSFTAFTTYLFADSIFYNKAAAFLAGMIVGFWPYTLSHHNHPNLIFIGFVPLALFCIARFLKHPTLSRGIMVGLSIGLIAIVRWQLLIYGFPLIFIYTIYQAGGGEIDDLSRTDYMRNIFRYALPALLILLVLTAVSMGPILLNLETTDFSSTSISANDTANGSTDLAAYMVPSRYHRFWGEGVSRLTGLFIINANYTPYIGVGTTLLAILGLVGFSRQSLIWFMTGGLYMSLALGPRLLVWGEPVWERMPYDLIEGSLIDAVIRRPDRLNIFLSIPIAMMAGYGLQVIQEIGTRASSHNQSRFFAPSAVVAALMVIVFAETITDYPMYTLEVPAWHQQLADEEGDFAILELPIHSRIYDEFYMQYQHVHGKRLVGGHVSRPPDSAFQFINSISFIGPSGSRDPSPQTVSVVQDFERLASADVRYVVLHKTLMSNEQLDQWERYFLMLPTYEDERVVVYATDAGINQALLSGYELDPPQAISLFDSQVSIPAPTQDGLIEAEAVWITVESIEAETIDAETIEVCLMLLAGPGNLVAQSCEPIDLGEGGWPAFALRRSSHRIEIPRYIDPADYQIVLQVNPAGGVKDLGRIVINVVPRRFEPPSEIEMPVDVSWEGIGLLGYELFEESLTLYWEAFERTDQYLIRFVHIVDAQTGQLVAQVDSAPRDYGYPTTWWEAGEIIIEEVILPVVALPEGEYVIYLGFYDNVTGTRIQIGENGTALDVSNDAVILSTFIKASRGMVSD